MKLLYCYLCLLILCGCSSNSNKDFIKEYFTDYPDLYEREIVLPKELKKIDGSMFSQPQKDKRVFIYSITDGTCGSCYTKILDWQKSLLNDKYSKYISIVFISMGGQISDQLQQFAEQERIELPILHDPEGKFMYKNGLEEFAYGIYITDKDKKVKLVGNPYNDPMLYKYLVQLIKSQK